MSLNEAKQLRTAYKNDGKTVVFTNGCFDILHAGHIQYLTQAAELGDVFILGLNTDASVKTNKGDARPINSQESRAIVLSALEVIDHIVFFNEKTPVALLEELKPDIHVKGGDYKAETLPEYQTITAYGGKIQILPFKKGFSTTTIIEKINRHKC